MSWQSKSFLDSWLQNPICEVAFAGFTSDTYTLQKNGWNISARQFHSLYKAGIQIQLVLKNKNAGLYALTNCIELPYSVVMSNMHEISKHLMFNICQVGSELIVQSHGVKDPNYSFFNGFIPIDAEPSFTSTKIEKISEMNIFKPMTRTQEIFIGPKTVPEALEYILKLQDPKQKEIRDKQRKEHNRKEMREILNGKPEEELVAQIITFPT